jgi:transcriptional regulator of acetoin/glycerol metabolism
VDRPIRGGGRSAYDDEVRDGSAIHEQLEAAATSLVSADQQARSAVAAARAAGVSWAAIGASLGVAATTAQRRWGPPADQETRARSDAAAAERAALRRTRAPAPLGTSVAEAAEVLGVSRQTLWRRVRAGEIRRLADGSIDLT